MMGEVTMEPNYLTVNLWEDLKAGYPRTLTYQAWGLSSALRGFVYDLRHGFRDRYPWCCVLEFSLRWVIGFPKFLNPERDLNKCRNQGHIPCFFHQQSGRLTVLQYPQDEEA